MARQKKPESLFIDANPTLSAAAVAKKARAKGLAVSPSAVYQYRARERANARAKRTVRTAAVRPDTATVSALEAELFDLELERQTLKERIDAARMREMFEQNPERVRKALALLDAAEHEHRFDPKPAPPQAENEPS